MHSTSKNHRQNGRHTRSLAIAFIIIFGIVSLLADIANEGVRSSMGVYLALLGASATAIGIVAGLCELIGYSLRIVFGWITDRTGAHWSMIFIGYGINLVAVPALALTGDWMTAVFLIMVERVGRAIRSPARDAMLSHAGTDVGRGWAYGLQEALSSVGGMIGPMIIVLVMLCGGNYQIGYEIMIVPLLFAMVLLAYAWRINPRPRDMEGPCTMVDTSKRLSRSFWIYVLAGALIAAGYADFPLVAFHIGNFAGVTEGWIPIMYAIAMAADALAALIFGKLYDKVGIVPLIVVLAFVPLFVPLTFSNDFTLVLVGMLLYGIGFGAQESVMRAVVADMTPFCRRASAFGYYNAVFGIAWFAGSLAMGVLYDVSIVSMMILSMSMQLLSIPVLILIRKKMVIEKSN